MAGFRRDAARAAAAVVDALERRRLLSVVPAGFAESVVAPNLPGLTAMDVAADGRVFLAQADGTIRVVENDHLVAAPFAKLTTDAYGERGMLGIALDPNFAQNQWVYVYYTATTPASHNRVSRLTANGDVMVEGSEKILFELPPVPNAVWHMGGGLHFGNDGKLYVGVGMHEQVPAAQDLSSMFGKMLRINSDGTIPADNPFYNSLSGNNRAIWAYGLRNPYTFGIDPVTGKMLINDVGQSAWEEIDVGAAGANYGWANVEGYGSANGSVSPAYAYPHTASGGAITGGTFYRPAVAAFPGQYVGKYFFEEFVGGWMKVFDPATNAVSDFASGLNFPCDLRTGADGSLYYVSRGSGSAESGGGAAGVPGLYKIQYVAPTAPKVTTQPAGVTVALGEGATFTAAAVGADPIAYQWQRNNVNIAGATGATYTVGAAAIGDDVAQYRCVATNTLGSATTSAAVLTVINGRRPTAVILTPAVGATYAGGDVISFSGSAGDAEDGALPAGAFSWSAVLVHHTHTHPFMAAVTGVKSGSFVIPLLGETDPDALYRVILTVTDSSGLTTTASRDVLPRLANVTVRANVAGLKVKLDSATIVGGQTIAGAVNLTRTLSAPRYQYANGVAYEFDSWSDGGAATHDIAFPAVDSTYTAKYKLAGTVYLSDLTATSAGGGWGPVELDQSNGERALGDGRPLKIEGVTYAKGLGTHAESEVIYDLGGAFSRFKADLGIDDEVGQAAGSVVYKVYLDGVLTTTSAVLRGNSAVVHLDVSVAGKTELRLVVADGGDGASDDHADWADAKLVVASGDGLSATYYDNANFTGAAVSRVDAGVNFDWKAVPPVAGIAAGTFSARWTGLVQPLFSEVYTFYVKGDDGVRLWVDDQLLVDRWGDVAPLAGDSNLDHVVDRVDYKNFMDHYGKVGATWADGDSNRDGRVDFADLQKLELNYGKTWPVEASGTIALEAGRSYDLRLEYYQNGGEAGVTLGWASASTGKGVIPQARLFSAPPVPPIAPTGLSAEAGAAGVTVSWSNVAQELGYRVERSTDGVHYFLVGSTGAGVTAFVDAGLAGGAHFYYRVRAYNAAGNSPYSGWADVITPGAGVVYVSDLTPVSSSNGWGVIEKDMSNGEAQQWDGSLISIGGVKYSKGLGMHAAGQAVYNLQAGSFATFQAEVGVDDEVGTGSVVFQVLSGSTVLYQSAKITGAMGALGVSVNIAGRSQITLKVLDAGDGVTEDHADWGNARLVAAGAAAVAPVGAGIAMPRKVVVSKPAPVVFSVKRVGVMRPARRKSEVLG